jgi:hypothetical protein
MEKKSATEKPSLDSLLNGKSQKTLDLFNHFVDVYKTIGSVSIHPAKTMIGVATSRKRIAYVTQLGKDFIHVVLPFEKPHPDNLCFQKIAQVPGDSKQFNHHLRIYAKKDINKEVIRFMKLAYENGLP